MLPVPPKSAMTPRRKQKLYDFAVSTFEYGDYLESFRNSGDYANLSEEEKIIEDEEFEMIKKLNEFQVTQISEY